MSDRLLFALTIAAALGCGVMAGAFFTFSTFVMTALGRLPAAQGVAAMQSINVAALNPLFFIALFGTASLCAVLAAVAIAQWHASGSILLLLGSLSYLVGCIGVTMACNVPLNNQLAHVVADSAAAADLWARYLSHWTMWNHVRTVAALAAILLFILRSSH
jgi:uncharacterized membrane protein